MVLTLYVYYFREIACEETEVFILSTANLERVKEVLARLDSVETSNQRTALNSIEKIENLYERLKLDQSEKYQFLSMNQVRAFIHQLQTHAVVFLFQKPTLLFAFSHCVLSREMAGPC